MFDVVAAVDASGLGVISALLLLLLLISLTACKRGNLPGELSFISFREDNDIDFFYTFISYNTGQGGIG